MVFHEFVIYRCQSYGGFQTRLLYNSLTVLHNSHLVGGSAEADVFFLLSFQNIKHSVEFVKQNIPCIVISDEFSVK